MTASYWTAMARLIALLVRDGSTAGGRGAHVGGTRGKSAQTGRCKSTQANAGRLTISSRSGGRGAGRQREQRSRGRQSARGGRQSHVPPCHRRHAGKGRLSRGDRQLGRGGVP